MSKIKRAQIPDCCHTCRNLDFDSKDEYSPNYYYCTKGIKIPVKKLSCKKRESSSEVTNVS
jgi:hypothetical protein